MPDMTAGFETLGVVPVFVNTGAALLPAILAGLASLAGALIAALALLFKPRELVRAVKRRPHAPVVAVLLLTGVVFLTAWWWSGAAGAVAKDVSRAAAAPNDWAKVAVELLRQEEQQRGAQR